MSLLDQLWRRSRGAFASRVRRPVISFAKWLPPYPANTLRAVLEIVSLLEESSTAASPTDVIASLARRLRVKSSEAALIFTSVGDADW